MLDKYEIGYIHAADQIDRYNFEDRKLIELVRCINENIEILVVDEIQLQHFLIMDEMYYIN